EVIRRFIEADTLAYLSREGVHTFTAEIGERVGLDEAANLLDRIVRGDELRARRRIDAVVAGADRRRRADAHVDFLSAGVAQHANDLSARGAAHDRVVHDDHALAFEHLALRVELDLDAEVTDRLLRLDEGSADVVIADEPEFQREARFFGVADRRRHA